MPFGLWNKKKKNNKNSRFAKKSKSVRNYPKSRKKTVIVDTKNIDFDKSLLIMILGLLIFGALMVFSSSFIVHEKQPLYFFIRQVIYIILGLGVGFMLFITDYRVLQKYVTIGLGISVILLILVLIPGIGKNINGATRWIDLRFFDLQPSELAKLTFILYLSAWASKQRQKMGGFNQEAIIDHIKEEIIPFVLILGFISVLILLEPDLGTTGILGLTALSVYFLSGRDSIHIIGTIFIALAIVFTGALAGVVAPYRMKRITTYIEFLRTGEVQDQLGRGYQLRNILIAVGSGGMFGVGFGESRQKFHYLGQTSFSDNIFAVIAEEFGFVGSVVLISVFFLFLKKGFSIASGAPDKFGKLLASGIVIWITLQAYLHIAANIGMIPLTGIPLPYISYGGSSIVVTLAASGLLLNISKYKK